MCWCCWIYSDISSITTLCPYPGIAIIIMSLLSIRSLGDSAILQSNLKSKTPLTIIPRFKPFVPLPEGDQIVGVKPFLDKKAAVPNEIDPAPAIPTLKVYLIFLTQD